MAQLNCCSLVWMCHNRAYKNRLNRLHEKYPRLICNYKQLSFKDNSVSIHHKNLQALAIEMFKVYT